MRLNFFILYMLLFFLNVESSTATDLDCIQGVWEIRNDENSYQSEYIVYKDHTGLSIILDSAGIVSLISYSTVGFFDTDDLNQDVDEKSLLESNTGDMFEYLDTLKQESLSFNTKLNDPLFYRVECSFCSSEVLVSGCQPTAFYRKRVKLPSPIINYLIAYRKDDLKYFDIEYEDHDVCSVLPEKIIYDLNFKPVSGFDTSNVLLSIIGKKGSFYKFEYESLDGKKMIGYVKKKDVEIK
ncbi:MAG: hypothetical protein IKN77_07575 [Paludibacteraceae bacterium]|nr:hypothetical protein [Paludibacteraceae bacterium]